MFNEPHACLLVQTDCSTSQTRLLYSLFITLIISCAFEVSSNTSSLPTVGLEQGSITTRCPLQTKVEPHCKLEDTHPSSISTNPQPPVWQEPFPPHPHFLISCISNHHIRFLQRNVLNAALFFYCCEYQLGLSAQLWVAFSNLSEVIEPATLCLSIPFLPRRTVEIA